MSTFSRSAAVTRRVGLAAVAFALLCAVPASMAAVDFTGTWNGPYQALSYCGETPEVSSGTATFYLAQAGTAIAGTGTLTFPHFGCSEQGQSLTLVFSLEGTVSENTFVATAVAPGLGTGFVAGILEGETMTSSLIAGEDVRMVGELTRTSTAPPASGLTGAYSGTYSTIENVSWQCSNISSISYSGSLTGNVIQVGNAVSAQLIALGVKIARPDASRNCTVVDETDPESIVLSGTISGNTITGWGGSVGEDPSPFTATISGTTISGSSPNIQGNQTTFTLSRTSATPAPVILGFGAEPSNIQPGRSAILKWATSNANVVYLDQGIGARPTTGSISVSPAATTQYTLTAKGPGGTVTAMATVTVTAAPAVVILSAHPEGMLQRAGEAGATDSYTLTNVGGAPTTITLSQTGSFFMQSPTSFTLAAGGSQRIALTATAQPAGVYEGTSAISGDGVRAGAAIPVVLLSAGSPSGPVDPRPDTRRKEIAAAAGEDPTGSVSFTNRGTGALEGIAISDADWLIPDVRRVSIAPGGTASVSFKIRRSLRPDGASPRGAAKARFGLVFFGAPFSSAGKTAMATTPVSKSLVTVVDLVKPGTTATTPPPLGTGELALFVAGMSSKAGETGDLLISSRSDAAISDLKIYYSASGGTPSWLAGSISSLVANSALALPGLVKNVFGKEAQTGTVQLRSSTLSEIVVTGTEVDTTAEDTPVATALPIFRSDRGADSGEEIVLPGVEQSSAATTALLIQEMTGAAATVQIDAFNAAGAAVGSPRTASVGGFALLELTDAVPAGAASVRIRNTASNSSRIAAAAMVADSVSGDVWTIVDSMLGLPLDESVFVPLLGGLQRVSAAETEILLLNGGSAPVTVSLNRTTTHPRKRPIPARGSGASSTPPSSAASENLSVSPNQTVSSVSSDGTAGYAVVSAGTSVRSVGRVEFAPASGGGRVGSSLPAVPASSAVGLGGSIRFPGVEDASDATEAARTPVTYSSDLVLIETSGGEAGVRVTVRFVYAVSTTLMSEIAAAADVTLAANRFYVMRDVVSTVLGAQRSRYGDLTDVTVDVEVTSGSGRVIAFVQSIDNASRDVIVRSQ